MAVPVASVKWPSEMVLRVASSIVLAPVVILAVWYGGLWLVALLVIGGAVAGREWASLCDVGTGRLDRVLIMVMPPTTVLVAVIVDYQFGLAVLLAGGLTLGWLFHGRSDSRWWWPTAGVFYLGLALLAFNYLRGSGADGRNTVIWLMVVVWATDIAAYFVGRAIGGPKLAPRISPSKTWSGLAGGVTAAAISGVVVMKLFGGGIAVWLVGLMGGLLAVTAQAGDLLESRVKRLRNVKDSGQLIPGHGGLLDRIDGLLPCAIVLGAVALLTEENSVWP